MLPKKVLFFAASPSVTLHRKLYDLMRGTSPALVHKLCGKSGERIMQLRDRWLREILLQDKEALNRFFEHGTAKIRILKAHMGIRSRRVIQQSELDDLFVSKQGLSW